MYFQTWKRNVFPHTEIHYVFLNTGGLNSHTFVYHQRGQDTSKYGYSPHFLVQKYANLVYQYF